MIFKPIEEKLGIQNSYSKEGRKEKMEEEKRGINGGYEMRW